LYSWTAVSHHVFNYYASQNNPKELEAVRIGTALNRQYTPNLGLNFALVRILPNDDTNIY